MHYPSTLEVGTVEEAIDFYRQTYGYQYEDPKELPSGSDV